MCGISGIISIKNNPIVEDLVKMNKIINHRGPDDEGYVLFNKEKVVIAGGDDTAESSWQEEGPYLPKVNINGIKFSDAAVAFGHRRLSILDLSPKGHQPMSDIDERYWITFNGEIYNYIELREQLIGLGHHFNTSTDTEVIIEAYKEWGVECQNFFNGMWSFAIYDSVEKNLFFSRDRFGIKPFYYWLSPKGDLHFASEIKQFTTVEGWKAILNGNRAYDYLYYSLTDHTDETMFKGVHILLPGNHFSVNVEDLLTRIGRGKLVTTQWYNPKIVPFKGTFVEAKEKWLNKFKEAIQLHLRADVPIGSALSGGLDSSSIVSYINILLREQGKSDLQKTFSSCAEDPRFDERKWMEEVVKDTKVDGHYIYPQGKDVFNLTEKLVYNMDEPYQSQSAFLGYHVFKEARKNNVVVLLNGQGADEYLSGYSDFRTLRYNRLIRQGKLMTLFKEIKSVKTFLRIFTSFTYGKIPMQLKFRMAKNKKEKLDDIVDISKVIKKKVHPYELVRYVKKSTLAISRYQLLRDPLQRYLRWEDRNSMAHSVEARVPFLDYRLVELTQSFPLDYLDGPNMTKRILVESMEGILNEKVRQRKDKMGFSTPEQNWLMTEYREEYIEMLRKYLPYAKGIIRVDQAEQFYKDMQDGKIPFEHSYWRIMQFCVWMKVYNVELE